MQAQLQIRQNALEVQDYMKDLFDWQKDIKQREKAASGSQRSGSDVQPAPRGKALSSVGAAPSTLQAPGLLPAAKLQSNGTSSTSQHGGKGTASATAAAHTYTSYSKWDKLKVDSDEEENGESRMPTSKGASTAAAGQKSTAAAAAELASSAPVLPNQSAGQNAATAVVPVPRSQDPSPLPRPTQPARSAALLADPPAAAPLEKLLPLNSPHRPAASSKPGTPAASSASTNSQLPPAALKPTAPAQTQATIPPPSTHQPTASTSSPPPSASGQLPPALDQLPPASAQLPPVRNSGEALSAEGWRLRGNQLFKAGQWALAQQCYSRSLEQDPCSAAAWANRAMAALKLGQWREAEADCSAALEQDPGYVKAFHRRASARLKLGQLRAAASDFEAALLLEPSNASLAAERAAALASYLQAAQVAPLTQRTRLPVTLLTPPVTPGSGVTREAGPAARGAPAAATGVAVGEGQSGDVAAPKVEPATKAETPGPPPASLPDAAAAGNAPLHSITASGGPAPSSSPTASAPSAPAPSSQPRTTSTNASNHTLTHSPAAASALPAAPLAPASVRPSLAAAASAAAATLASRPAAARGAPRTSSELESAWRGLKGDLAGQAALLGSLDPAQLPALFKFSVTPALLAGMLLALLTALDVQGGGVQSVGDGTVAEVTAQCKGCALTASRALDVLLGLSALPRLEMAAMCVGRREREQLSALWGRVFGCGAHDSAVRLGCDLDQVEKVTAVRQKFKL
ncbi:hypothetical protein QJQ45_002990 [Haematococcus lacustris]|nr:hypothetical protein QJQ45_002990 [Haematococcus lacustris]